MRRNSLSKLAELYCNVHNLYYEAERKPFISLFSKKRKPSEEAKKVLEELKYTICKIIETETGCNTLFSEIFPEKLHSSEIMSIIDKGVKK